MLSRVACFPILTEFSLQDRVFGKTECGKLCLGGENRSWVMGRLCLVMGHDSEREELGQAP